MAGIKRTGLRAIAILLCAATAAGGCATTSGARGVAVVAGADRRAATHDVLAEYVRSLAPGSPIRIGRAGGATVRGTLMKATAQSVIIQPRTRIPEPPLEIAWTDIITVTPESTGRNGVGKAIAIGAAAGAGAALGLLMILAAIYAD